MVSKADLVSSLQPVTQAASAIVVSYAKYNTVTFPYLGNFILFEYMFVIAILSIEILKGKGQVNNDSKILSWHNCARLCPIQNENYENKNLLFKLYYSPTLQQLT